MKLISRLFAQILSKKLKVFYVGDRKQCVSIQDVSHHGWSYWEKSAMLKKMTITLQQIAILTHILFVIKNIYFSFAI